MTSLCRKSWGIPWLSSGLDSVLSLPKGMGLIFQRASVHLSTLWLLIAPHLWASSDAFLEKKKKETPVSLLSSLYTKNCIFIFFHVNC